MSCSDTDGCEVERDLRAQVEAERGIWQETARRFCQNADYWRERAESAEARLAAVEAAHTCAASLWAHEVAKVAEQRERAESAEARLAEVEALCMRSEWAEWPFAKKVLAAARGEGDHG